MAFSLRKTSDRGTVGLDIDGRYLAAAQVGGGRVVRGASQELPEGLVRDGEVVDPRGARPAPQELRGRRRPAAQRAARGGQPADRRARGRAAAHRGRQAARRRGPLPGVRGDRDAARRGRARPPGRRLHDRAPTARPRMQVVLVAARRKMVETLLEAVKGAGLKADGVDLDAFALVRTLATREATSAERGRARVLPPRRRDQPRHRGRHRPASSPGRCRPSGTRTTPARGWPTRSGCRSTTT